MKHIFVLDENVFRDAVVCVDRQGTEDSQSFRVILNVMKNCHSLAIDPIAREKYVAHVEDAQKHLREHVAEALALIQAFQAIFRTAEKVRELRVLAPPLPGDIEGAFHEKDRFLLRIAAACGAKIITKDPEVLRRVPQFVTPQFPQVKALDSYDANQSYTSDP